MTSQRCIELRPGEPMKVRNDVDLTSLPAITAVVGETIDFARAYAIDQNLHLIVDDEGLLHGLPRNLLATCMYGQQIVGPVLVVRTDAAGETVGLTDQDIVRVTSLAIAAGLGPQVETPPTEGGS